MMTAWIYALVAHAMRLLAWASLWWLGRRTPAFRERWAERRARAPLPAGARGGIVLHAVSMGEVTAATPLVEALLRTHPDLPLLVTCTSPTASALIRERFGDRVHHCYLPFDTPGAMRRFVDGLAPRLLIVMETELWPHLLRRAQRRGAAVVVAGGRLSERSARRYGLWPAFTRRLLASVDLLLVQDEATRRRFTELGAAPARTVVAGSPKFDLGTPVRGEQLRARFRAMTAGRRVWLAASTHEGEEEPLLDALSSLIATWPSLLLVLVPRHPQRFEAVAALLTRRGLRWQRRTDLGADGACASDAEVLLGDTMGELHAWFGAAELAYIGGSLIARGGHSPLEAMACGTPLLSGPQVFNFAAVYELLRSADGVVMVDHPAGLESAVRSLLDDPRAARARGERARAVFEGQRGAAARSAAAVRALLQRLPAMRQDAAGLHAVDASLADRLGTEWFDPARWVQARPVQGSGRGSAWFVQSEGVHAVLRHSRRGGWMARLMGDRYLRLPGVVPRALAEFALLRRLRAWGLPVPRPLAARAQPSAAVLRGDILVERIEGSVDLARRLHEAPLSPPTWRSIGAAIGRLHAHGVVHGDLNCRNLLLDDAGATWIIDFDGSRVAPGVDGGAVDLTRLRRSLRKEVARSAAWHWDEARDWPLLEQGHAQGRAARPAADWAESAGPRTREPVALTGGADLPAMPPRP